MWECQAVVLIYLKELIKMNWHFKENSDGLPLNDAYRSQYDIAKSLMQQHLYEDASQKFLNLAKSYPNDWNLLYMAGQCYRFADQYAEAINLLEKAADMKPNDAVVLMALGIAFQLSEDYTSALTAFEQVIHIEPENWNAYNSMGLTYKKKGDLQEALECYHRAIGIYSTGLVSKSSHKYTSYEIDDEGTKVAVVDNIAMVKVINEVLRSEIYPATISNNIGVCYLSAGDVESAKDAFNESIHLTPDGVDYPTPHHHLRQIKEDASKGN
jgi:tetratricopeptide (TPR) repeat protein